MHAALGDSLDHVREQIAGHYGFDEARLGALIAKLRAGERRPPSTFGWYCDLVERIVADDRAEAENLIARIIDGPPAGKGLRVLSFAGPALLNAAGLYRR